MSKHIKAIVDDAFARAQAQMGFGWNHISKELQDGLVSSILLGYLHRQAGCDEEATQEEQARVALRVRDVMKEMANRK